MRKGLRPCRKPEQEKVLDGKVDECKHNNEGREGDRETENESKKNIRTVSINNVERRK